MLLLTKCRIGLQDFGEAISGGFLPALAYGWLEATV